MTPSQHQRITDQLDRIEKTVTELHHAVFGIRDEGGLAKRLSALERRVDGRRNRLVAYAQQAGFTFVVSVGAVVTLAAVGLAGG